MDQVALVHYSEIGLKGGNRDFFERVFRDNLKSGLSGLPYRRLKWLRGLFLIELSADTDRDILAGILSRIPGVAYFAMASRVDLEPSLKLVAEESIRLCRKEKFNSFRITTRRSVKSFPLTSSQVNTQVGAEVQRATGGEVNLRTPDLVCHIDLIDKWAYLYTSRSEGLRGLPVGSSGKVVSLISAGIDSPVATHRMQCRGCRIIFVHFHSAPYTSRESQEQAGRLVETLAVLQHRATLHLVPFSPVQQQIIAGSPPEFRVILYRRSMFRLAEQIARRQGARGLVTGESLGQVASQTLENLAAIQDAVELPVLRPLIGTDKESIIREAKRIGTYDISIEPHDDCCSYLLPAKVATRAGTSDVRRAEEKLGEDLLEHEYQALGETEIRKYDGSLTTHPSATV